MISCTVTAELICILVFAYTKSRFSYEAALLFCDHFQYFPQIICCTCSLKFSPPLNIAMVTVRLIPMGTDNIYCRFGNVREDLIFANIREIVASQIQSSH